MRDYSELVKALHHCDSGDLVECLSCQRSGTDDCHRIFRDAADAIVELLVERDNWETIAKHKSKIIIMRELPNWISVEEMLPPAYDSVITANKNGDVQWNYLINEKEHFTWCNGYHITHWMLPPKPPKVVE